MRFDEEEMEALYAGYRCQDYCHSREKFEPGYAARNDGGNRFGETVALQ
jgi:hypothetical protein